MATTAKIRQIRTQCQKPSLQLPGLKGCPPHLRQLDSLKQRPVYQQKLGLLLPQEVHDKQGFMQFMSPGHLTKIISNLNVGPGWPSIFMRKREQQSTQKLQMPHFRPCKTFSPSFDLSPRFSALPNGGFPQPFRISVLQQ